MVKNILILLSAFLLFGCKSRDKKAAELIKQDMFKTLYDFESYEPIETKIDSAFTSIYTDSVIKSYAYLVKATIDDINKELEKFESAKKIAEIWVDSRSSYGRNKYKDAYNKMREHLEGTNSKMKIVDSYIDSIKNASLNFKSEFYGWKATHRFRCKTKGGNSDIGNYIYVFDINMDKIIYQENIDDQYVKNIKSLIESAKKGNI